MLVLLSEDAYAYVRFECTKNKTKLLLSNVKWRISKEIVMKIINYEYAQYEEEKKNSLSPCMP